MSYHRTITAQERADGITLADRTVVIDGRPRYLCRFCGALCEGRRTSYCSNTCVHEWMIRSDPTYARAAVFERDHGVCAACGVDTEPLADALAALRWWPEMARGAVAALGWSRSDIVVRGVLVQNGQGVDHRERVAAVVLWHADHIVPVVHGGGACGLENLQTLCAPCHRRKTAGR